MVQTLGNTTKNTMSQTTMSMGKFGSLNLKSKTFVECIWTHPKFLIQYLIFSGMSAC